MADPGRGEVWITDLGYAAKIRPCLVLSVPPTDTERALVSLVPHTTKPRVSRFEVPTALAFLRPGVFDAQGIVTVPRARLVRRIGVAGPELLGDVEHAVASWLGLTAGT